jgi:hypothetical protein
MKDLSKLINDKINQRTFIPVKIPEEVKKEEK